MNGIVQSSGIGPLLFLIFINALIKHLIRFGVSLNLYANDKVSAEIVDNYV